MRDEYDFSDGKRGAIIPATGKTRISIYIDDSTLDAYREMAHNAGTGYQWMMADALKAYLDRSD